MVWWWSQCQFANFGTWIQSNAYFLEFCNKKNVCSTIHMNGSGSTVLLAMWKTSRHNRSTKQPKLIKPQFLSQTVSIGKYKRGFKSNRPV